MKKLKSKVVSSFFIVFILQGTILAGAIQSPINQPAIVLNKNQRADNYYFVHLTDTHVAHNWYDHNETRKHWLISLLQYVTSFETPPAFVVITGDLVEWGEGFFGALNYHAFTQCFYKNNIQWYADKNCTIPVYFTPGNHDYYPYRMLWNYHLFIHRIPIKNHDRYMTTYKNDSLFFMNSGPNSYATYNDKINSRAVGLTNEDIAWLDQQLNGSSASHKIILMHHPAVNLRNQDGDLYDVFIQNRVQFIALCEKYDVDIVLAGHTHEPRVFDADEHLYENLPLNCSKYLTVFVQSDDCKESVNYRNISLVGNDMWIEPSQAVNVTSFLASNFFLQTRDFLTTIVSGQPPIAWF